MASSATPSTPASSGYAAAREKLAHRFRSAGVLDVAGEGRISFLQGQLTQEMTGLAVGECRPAAGLTSKGKLLFVARVVGLEDRVRLVVPASIRRLVLEHLRKYAVFTKVGIEDPSEEFVRVVLYGPEASRLRLPVDLNRLPADREIAGEVLAPSGRRAELEALLLSAGSAEVPEETAEVLRVEAGRPRFGSDMDSTNLPDEVGMDEAISTTKGCYVGQEVVARLRTYGRVNRRLVSFRFPQGPIEAGDLLRRPDEETLSRIEAGRVTSSVVSPLVGAIGLGYAFRDVASGARLVSVSKPELSAIVSDLRSE
jgi:folate-binding protein YgfZ